MSNIVYELDNLMMRRGFGIDVSKHPTRLYRNNGYDVSFEPNTHGMGLRGNVWYSGSTLNFSLKGDVKEEKSEHQYRWAIQELKSRLNEQFNGNGVNIATCVCIPFNGGKEIKLSNLLLDYKKETSPRVIANAVGLIQEQVYELLKQYVG